MIWLRAVVAGTPRWVFARVAFPLALLMQIQPKTYKQTVLDMKRRIETADRMKKDRR